MLTPGPPSLINPLSNYGFLNGSIGESSPLRIFTTTGRLGYPTGVRVWQAFTAPLIGEPQKLFRMITPHPIPRHQLPDGQYRILCREFRTDSRIDLQGDDPTGWPYFVHSQPLPYAQAYDPNFRNVAFSGFIGNPPKWIPRGINQFVVNAQGIGNQIPGDQILSNLCAIPGAIDGGGSVVALQYIYCRNVAFVQKAKMPVRVPAGTEQIPNYFITRPLGGFGYDNWLL